MIPRNRFWQPIAWPAGTTTRLFVVPARQAPLKFKNSVSGSNTERQKIKFCVRYDPPLPTPHLWKRYLVPTVQHMYCTMSPHAFWGHVKLNYVDFIELSALLKKWLNNDSVTKCLNVNLIRSNEIL